MPDATLLDSVIQNEELQRRPRRTPDREAEKRGLALLAEELAGSPRRVLQKLSDVALALCRAHTAGISLVEEEAGRRVFRWHAVSGAMAHYLWTTLPRDFSPCGTVLERESPQLMIDPERYYTPLAGVSPRVHEALLTPFAMRGEIVGTVWVVAHDTRRKFDSEDLRLLQSLGRFAATAYERLSSLSAEDVLALARLNQAQTPPPVLPRRTIQRRVLVVDDNLDAAHSLQLLLQNMGHRVEVANTGADALRIARAVRPDIVLLDLAMPDMSGHEVARQLRLFLDGGVRIVALTGFAGEEDRRAALEAGFDQHIVKPIDPGVLKSLVG